MVTLVTINGIGKSGKSTFISLCDQYCQENHPEIMVTELSTVDYVKDIAIQCGWDGSKEQKDRIFLSDLKKALEKWDDIPLKELYKNLEAIRRGFPDKSHIFFVNARESNDIERIFTYAKIKNYSTISLLIVNPNVEVDEVPELINDILQSKSDINIVNDGTLSDLTTKAENFIEKIIN